MIGDYVKLVKLITNYFVKIVIQSCKSGRRLKREIELIIKKIVKKVAIKERSSQQNN